MQKCKCLRTYRYIDTLHVFLNKFISGKLFLFILLSFIMVYMYIYEYIFILLRNNRNVLCLLHPFFSQNQIKSLGCELYMNIHVLETKFYPIFIKGMFLDTVRVRQSISWVMGIVKIDNYRVASYLIKSTSMFAILVISRVWTSCMVNV